MPKGFTMGMRSSLDDTWTTPIDFFEKLHNEFNFTLDAAALKSSALVTNYLGPDHENIEFQDALIADWHKAAKGGSVWLNPPYGKKISLFLNKANVEAQKGLTVVALVPSRTDTRWWWDNCIQHEIRFIKGRLKFGNSKQAAPFPSAVIIMKGPNDCI